MYTSFMNTAGNLKDQRGFKNRAPNRVAPTKEELTEGVDTLQQPLLQIGQRILGGKAVVQNMLSLQRFVVYHEDFRQEFVVQKIGQEENIEQWVDLQAHSNIVTAFDQFTDDMMENRYSMCEHAQGGSMFGHIKSLNLNLSIDVPKSYIEKIYDIAIQMASALDFAHNAGLVHGQLDLSKVVLDRDGDNIVYKITDFAPKSSLNLPLKQQAGQWRFAKKGSADISTREKTELLMLKDIYSLGICILELMIGRTSKQKFSISLDSLPLTWAEFPESTPLIQVLVECIQIDNITQRKGRLHAIRKLLIREYKKFFQKPFYKMEQPYVGKKADVFNKKGIVALFNNKEGEALKCWSEARILSDRHFDSQCNFCLYRWSTGRISDAQLFSELGQFVFSAQGKGETLHGYLLIANGEREEGMQILKEFIDRCAGEIKINPKLCNLKSKREMQEAEEVYNEVQLDKATFPNNLRIKHNHKGQIDHVSYSTSGSYFISICSDSTKVWKVVNSIYGCYVTIPSESDKVHPQGLPAHQDELNAVATANNEASLVVVHRANLFLNVYDVENRSEAKLRETIDLQKEISANGQGGFSFNPRSDQILSLKLLEPEQPSMLRVSMLMQGEHHFADVNLEDGVTSLRKAEPFSDHPTFTEKAHDDETLQRKQENMKQFINTNLTQGNQVFMPCDEKRIVVVLNNGDSENLFYQVYDGLRNDLTRRVAKLSNYDTATAVTPDGFQICFIEGEHLVVRSIRVPNSSVLVDKLRPRFAKAETKLNPASAGLNRQTFKDKLYRELHAYHLFKENPDAEKQIGLTEEQNVQLMVQKYQEGIYNPYKLKANRELMMLQKVLLKDAVKTAAMRDLQAKCPLVGVEGLKRIEIYDDELKFQSPNAIIDHVQISSEPYRNFFLLSMGKVVYKYDLVTKELLFQFRSASNRAISLYDKDDKLVAADEREIRLWDFDDHKEEAPALWAASLPSIEIEQVYTNEPISKEDPFFVLVTSQEKWVLFSGRLEEKFSGSLEQKDGRQIITSAAFTKNSGEFLLGTNQGRIISYKTQTGDKNEREYQAGGDKQTISQIKVLQNIEENDGFLLTLDKTEIFVYVHNKFELKDVDFGDDGQDFAGGEISDIAVALNNKFFVIGIPEKRAIGFFGLNRVQLITKPLKWITKYPFVRLFADNHLSSLMLLDEKQQQLDYHFILWKFDTSKLDNVTLQKLDNGVVGQDEESEELNSEDEDSDLSDSERAAVQKIKGSACCAIF